MDDKPCVIGVRNLTGGMMSSISLTTAMREERAWPGQYSERCCSNYEAPKALINH